MVPYALWFSERIRSDATLVGMRLAFMLLACASGIGADESGDRAAIESVFRALNAAPTRKAMAALFTSDADPVEIDRPSGGRGTKLPRVRTREKVFASRLGRSAPPDTKTMSARLTSAADPEEIDVAS